MSGTDVTTQQRQRRGGRGRHAGGALRGPLGEAAARRGFAEPEVLVRWPEIVGADLAGRCVPVKVSYGRRAPGLGATLTVRVTGAHGPEVELLAPTILERINAFYGYRAVARLRITQAGAPGGFAEPAAGFSGPGADDVPSPEARARAEDLTRDIAHPGLRRALARLGARVLSPRPQD